MGPPHLLLVSEYGIKEPYVLFAIVIIKMVKSSAQSGIPHTPRWIKILLLITTSVIILRITGILHFPKHWVIGAAVIEAAIAIIELTVFITVIRYFYKQHASTSSNKFEAMARAQADEMRASGLPNWLTGPLERVMIFEAKIYNRIFRILKSTFNLVYKR